MKFVQMAKRMFLFMLVNILVVATISIVLSVLGVGRYMPGGSIVSLAIFCLVWGFAGALISLAMSRMMARWMMGVKVIDPNTQDPDLRALVSTVHRMAEQAGLPRMPQVGIYESPDVNAFATGPTRARSLVAVSSGLLHKMRQREVEGVLAHEIAHISNGDMVTLTLIQGVMNAFVMFLSRVLAFAIGNALRSRDDRGGGGIEFLLVFVFQIVFGILGSMVVAAFSRWREFRADAGGASIAGRDSMVSALRALQRMHEPALAAAEAQRAQSFQSMKISGHRGGLMALFSTHPPLEARIARLESSAY